VGEAGNWMCLVLMVLDVVTESSFVRFQQEELSYPSRYRTTQDFFGPFQGTSDVQMKNFRQQLIVPLLEIEKIR